MSVTETTQAALEHAAESGTVDISEWPRLLEDLLQRLQQIVHNDFPLPDLPPPISSGVSKISSTPPPLPDAITPADAPSVALDAEQSTKENDISAIAAAASVAHDLEPSLPPDMLSSYQSSVRILQRDFSQSPPYTVQRLSELVLQPRRYYRYLPAYLRALDRVVSVSSSVSDFPLSTGVANINGGFLTNGDLNELSGIQEREGLGSDESLGGALLTPIPWLRNGVAQEGQFHSEQMDTIMGPNGAGSIETVSVILNGIPSASQTSPNTSTPASPTLSEQSDASTNSSGSFSTDAQLRELGGVTQGELLRQEQEAGVIPIAQISRRANIVSSHADATSESASAAPPDDVADSAEELPHARGPETIGMEDTGMVNNTSGIDIEAAVGRNKSPQPELAQNERAADGEAHKLP